MIKGVITAHRLMGLITKRLENSALVMDVGTPRAQSGSHPLRDSIYVDFIDAKGFRYQLALIPRG